MPIWRIGDRVTRPVFMDDGTWHDEGDSCLSHSPLRRGRVVAIEQEEESGLPLYRVRWGSGGARAYFGHGIAADNEETP